MIESPVPYDPAPLIQPLSREILRAPWVENLSNRILAHHPDTYSHSQRVSQIARKMGEEMGLTQEDLLSLERGGLLHDLGKIAVPLTILDKNAPLEEEERKELDNHPQTGFDLIKPHDEVVALIALYHHSDQKRNYPQLPMIADPKIKLLKAITSCADKIDALLSPRSYKNPWKTAEARLALDGGFYDLKMVNRAIEIHTSFNKILA